MKTEKLTAAQRFAQLGERLNADGRLDIDRAKVELSEKIYVAMQERGITEAELARRIDSSRAYVNKVLQGGTNFTVESLVKIGRAIGCELKIDLVEDKTRSKIAVDEHLVYIEIEEPIDQPIILSAAAGNARNIVDFGEYRSSKAIKVGSNAGHSQSENKDAAVQNAA